MRGKGHGFGRADVFQLAVGEEMENRHLLGRLEADGLCQLRASRGAVPDFTPAELKVDAAVLEKPMISHIFSLSVVYEPKFRVVFSEAPESSHFKRWKL